MQQYIKISAVQGKAQNFPEVFKGTSWKKILDHQEFSRNKDVAKSSSKLNFSSNLLEHAQANKIYLT